MHDCPLCPQNNLLTETILAETSGAYLIRAKSSKSNFLIVPKTHVESPIDLPENWWGDFSALLKQVPKLGQYNLSLNMGKSAGQTVAHIHFWVIPRTADAAASGKGLARLLSES